MMCHAVGNQGNWFARVDAPRHPDVHERDLPCIWDVLSNGREYRDCGFDLKQKKFLDQAAAIQAHPFVIMRKRDRSTADDVWRSAGYVAIFKIKDVQVAGNELSFTFVERVCELA